MKTFVKKPVKAASQNASTRVRKVVQAVYNLELAVQGLSADELAEFEELTGMTYQGLTDMRFDYAYGTGVTTVD